MTGLLTFGRAPDRKVHWGDTLAGTIEPMLGYAGKWAYLPSEDGAWKVPNALRECVFFDTQRQIKSTLRRRTRFADR